MVQKGIWKKEQKEKQVTEQDDCQCPRGQIDTIDSIKVKNFDF